MLVLSRKVDEQIKIGDDITLVVCRIDNGRVRLGIVAPTDIPIVRSELDDQPPAPVPAAA